MPPEPMVACADLPPQPKTARAKVFSSKIPFISQFMLLCVLWWRVSDSEKYESEAADCSGSFFF
jgi:hypothetical protein